MKSFWSRKLSLVAAFGVACGPLITQAAEYISFKVAGNTQAAYNLYTNIWNYSITSAGAQQQLVSSNFNLTVNRGTGATAPVTVSFYDGFGGTGSNLFTITIDATNFVANGWTEINIAIPLIVLQAGTYSIKVASTAPNTGNNKYQFKETDPLALYSNGTPVNGLYWIQDASLGGTATTNFNAADVFADFRLSNSGVVISNSKTNTINYGNYHVGSTLTTSLTLSNSAPPTTNNVTERLGVTSATSGQATVTNLTGGLLAVGSSTNFSVGLSSVAGANSGTITLSFSSSTNGTSLTSASVGAGTLRNGYGGVTNIGSQVIVLTGTGYRYAAISVSSNINLGTVHVGGSFTAQPLSISNSATADGYSEALSATFGAQSGSTITTNGTVSLLAAGSTTNGLTVNLSAAAAGTLSGTVTLNLTSDGSGSSGLGQTTLPGQNVTVSGNVFSGYATWSGSGGSFGTAASWTDNLTPSIHAVPGTFAGFDNVDKATFSGSGGTVNLDGASPSLLNLAFGGSNPYTLAQGSGGGVTLKGSGASIDVTGTATHVLSAPLTLANAISINTALGSALRLTGSVSGAYPISKTGPGTLDVSTTVPGDVDIYAGTLAGSGPFSQNLTIHSGATLTPGTAGSPIGTLTASNLTLQTGAITVLDIASLSQNDLVNAQNVNWGGDLVINIAGTYSPTNTWDLFSFTSQAGDLNSITLKYDGNDVVLTKDGDIWSQMYLGNRWTYDEQTGDLQLIPEPSALALVAIGLLPIMLRRRSVRRRS